jgi:hypothetical protein
MNPKKGRANPVAYAHRRAVFTPGEHLRSQRLSTCASIPYAGSNSSIHRACTILIIETGRPRGSESKQKKSRRTW